MHRSPARWLGPLALIGAIVAVLMVSNSDTGKKSSSNSGGASTVTSSSTSTTRTTTTPKHHGRFYVVKAGETMSSIAAKTGVALTEIIRLNPHVDAQTLSLGQRLKLSP